MSIFKRKGDTKTFRSYLTGRAGNMKQDRPGKGFGRG